jgi:hypothetical protein
MMPRIQLLSIGILVFSLQSDASIWNDGTANTLPAKRFEIGVLHTPCLYGVTDRTEISLYVLWDAFVPNLSVKRRWGETQGFIFASSHGVFSPTPFLRMVSREKTGGLLPPDNYVPWYLVFDSYAFLTHAIAGDHLVTLNGGIRLPVAFADKSDERPVYKRPQTIDYAFIFPRTAYVTKSPTISPEASVKFTGPLVSDFSYSAECAYFFLPVRDNLQEEDFLCWALEPSALLYWRPSKRFSCHIGAIASFGTYPFGSNWILYPLLDIAIGFGK